MNLFKRITSLAFISCLLIIVLVGSITSKYDDLKVLAKKEEPLVFCGTAYMPGSHEARLSIKAKEGEALFLANCKSCHRIDQALVGPALRGVFQRRDSSWIRQMIVNGTKLYQSRNKEAVKLFKKYNTTEHFNFENLSKKEVNSLMEYLRVNRTK